MQRVTLDLAIKGMIIRLAGLSLTPQCLLVVGTGGGASQPRATLNGSGAGISLAIGKQLSIGTRVIDTNLKLFKADGKLVSEKQGVYRKV